MNEDLLKPRYKVIADYPNTKFLIGEIFIQNSNGAWYDKSRQWVSTLMPKFEKYPHLFRKLEWWEERQTEEMPEYVMDKVNNSILYKVYGWLQNCAMFYFAPDENSITHTEYFIPAIHSDKAARRDTVERSVATDGR